MEFMLGCNYWASNAGTEMWRNFDADVIENDIKILSAHGVKYMRVFPIWRDFQPIMPLYSANGNLVRYCLEGERKPKNKYYLDETMLDRFEVFLKICEKYGIKLIIGLITGWMSGRLFVPSALYGKNVITDVTARYFEKLFIKGFVTRFKASSTIYAWDLGNECNCMGRVADRIEAASWTAEISGAIKSADNSRSVVSGMHSLSIDKNWTISDQAEFTDILTTHPYAYWCEHTRIDEILSFRTLMHPTAQTKFYAEIGEKPCLAEEIGTMGPMLCSDENAAKFLRYNMFSLWANNAVGAMWWCANDQQHLGTYPFTDVMVERELGLLTRDKTPKPVLKEIKKFSEFLKSIDFEIREAAADAVCLLTREQDQWGVGYMTYNLLKQVGLNCDFAYADNQIPESKLYVLPSLNGTNIMEKCNYEALLQRVFNGADVYISLDNAVLSEFEKFSGLKIIDSFEAMRSGSIVLNSTEIPFSRVRNFKLQPTTAEILAHDNNGNPAVTVNKYGKGRVFVVNFPLEAGLLSTHNAFSGQTHLIYKTLFAEYINKSSVLAQDENITVTYNPYENGGVVTLLNHSEEDVNPSILLNGVSIDKVYYGDTNCVKAFDACVFTVK